MKNFIRSYHNGDIELWRKRWAKNISALKFFDKYNLELIVIAQNWEDDMVTEVQKDFPRIKFDRQGKLGCGGSLNYALKNYLYNTDDDCIFLMDDDVELYDGIFGSDLRFEAWKSIEKHIGEVKGSIGSINLNSKRKFGEQRYLTCPEVIKNGKIAAIPLEPTTSKARRCNYASFYINTKKFYNKEIYTADFNPVTKRYCHEDWWMNLQYRLNGIPEFRSPFLLSFNAWKTDAVISEDERSKTFNKDESLMYNDFEQAYGVKAEKLLKDYEKETRGQKYYFPLETPVEFDAMVLVDQFSSWRMTRLQQDTLYGYSDDRRERLEALKEKNPRASVIVENVRADELKWMASYRSIISGYTTDVPETLAEEGKILLIFYPQPKNINLTKTELLCYNQKIFDKYMKARGSGKQIKEYESILMSTRFQVELPSLKDFM